MLAGNHYHLTYCANVHPGNTWEEAFTQLKNHIPKVKLSVSPDQEFGVGLYLSDRASQEILYGHNLAVFKSWLNSENLYVFTMNGFPFGNFHGAVVKDNVYKPDWSSRERVEYTKRLFSILSELLPETVDGGISTSPVSYKYWHQNTVEKNHVIEISCLHLSEMAHFLDELSRKTGKHFHLDIEPEPDCLLENTDESIEFLNQLSEGGNEEIIRKHINLCFDVCHFSVEYEAPEMALDKLISAGIKIGKIQISSALKATSDDQAQSELRHFAEPRYLHQTVKKLKSGELKHYRDLPGAIEHQDNAEEWRTHFHVPLFLARYGNLYSTQDDVLKVLSYLKKHHITNHLEVETYTWDVLPAGMKTDLTGSIIRELEWVKKNLEA